jgi:hypothetical protein
MTVAIPNVLGQVEDVRAPGVLVLRSPGGEELRITPMQEAEGDDLFLGRPRRRSGRARPRCVGGHAGRTSGGARG